MYVYVCIYIYIYTHHMNPEDDELANALEGFMQERFLQYSTVLHDLV